MGKQNVTIYTQKRDPDHFPLFILLKEPCFSTSAECISSFVRVSELLDAVYDLDHTLS